MDVVHLEIRADRTAAPKFGHGTVGNRRGGDGGGTILVEPDIGRHIEGGADAEKPIETSRGGTGGEGLGEVDILERGTVADPIQAEVPFAEDGGGVAMLLEKGGDRETAGLDERGVVALEDALFELPAPRVATGEERIAARRAKRGGGSAPDRTPRL